MVVGFSGDEASYQTAIGEVDLLRPWNDVVSIRVVKRYNMETNRMDVAGKDQGLNAVVVDGDGRFQWVS